MKTFKRWTVGDGQAPDWLQDKLQPFLAADGGTAFEIDVPGRSYVARRGDVVTMQKDGYIKVEAVSD